MESKTKISQKNNKKIVKGNGKLLNARKTFIRQYRRNGKTRKLIEKWKWLPDTKELESI